MFRVTIIINNFLKRNLVYLKSFAEQEEGLVLWMKYKLTMFLLKAHMTFVIFFLPLLKQESLL
ncbi:MAG: hypothetical protein CMK92_06760 [Pseudomonas sp.]|nr:hypothetical protein [Pseudomonas sp.]